MILTLKYRHLMAGEETAPVVSLDGVPAFLAAMLTFHVYSVCF